jgi:hypothetical protein
MSIETTHNLLGDFTVVSYPGNVSVTWIGSSFRERGTASAGLVQDKELGEFWYVNRVLVQGDGTRGKGVGSQMLKLLQTEVLKLGGKLMIVEPGGYNSDPKQLDNFYGKHGFQRVKNGWMEWRPT